MRHVAKRIKKPIHYRHAGATLITTLLVLSVVLLLGVASAQLALQGAKSAYNDRDRDIAFYAAEAALYDAQHDIEGTFGHAASRAHLFDASVLDKLAQQTTHECGTGSDNPLLGICQSATKTDLPVWQRVDFFSSGKQMVAVPYGRFTGQILQTGHGTLPALPPRYIVEFLPDTQATTDATRSTYLYRITALGVGTRTNTQVALQILYRKLPA